MATQANYTTRSKTLGFVRTRRVEVLCLVGRPGDQRSKFKIRLPDGRERLVHNDDALELDNIDDILSLPVEIVKD